MKTRRKAPARVLAVLALIAAIVLVVAVVQGSLDKGSSSRDRTADRQRPENGRGEGGEEPARVPKAYVVKSGDTLTGIARKTGVSVERIQELNPGVDPQILISGQKLNLR